MIPDFSHIYKNKIGQIDFFCCILTLLCLCPVGCFSSKNIHWDSQQDWDFATSGPHKKIQSDQSYSYIMRKFWYYQIWIQNYLGFIVSDLMYICAAYIFEKVHIAVQFQQLSFKLLNFIFHPVKAVKSRKVFYSSHLQKKRFISDLRS